MTQIKATVTDQMLAIVQNPLLAAGDVGTAQFQVDFGAEWDGFIKTAVFYQQPDKVYSAILDTTGACVIPWEAIQNEGALYLGVFGIKGEYRKTTEVVRYLIRKGAYCETIEPAAPTPNIYEQILAAVGAHSENKNNPHGVTIAQIGAAPAGYGYGETLVMTEFYTETELEAHLDQLLSGMSNFTSKQFRFCVYDITTYNTIGELYFTSALNGGYATLIAHGYTGTGSNDPCLQFTLKKVKVNGVWQPFEWVNPPMALSVEYRTTERWNGKAVYTKLINFGALPNATIKMVNIGLDASQIFHVDFKVYNGEEMCSDVGNHVYNCAVYVYNTELTVVAKADMSAFNGFATLRYTKD